MSTALIWKNAHPELMTMLEDLRDASSLRLLLMADEWQRKDFDSALERLTHIKDYEEWQSASFLNSLMLQTDMTDAEVLDIARRLTTGVLVSSIGQLTDDDIPGNKEARLAVLMMPEFHSRKDRSKDQWIPFSMAKAKKIALRQWSDGKEQDAYRLLEEVFFNCGSDRCADLIQFAAIAKACGKLNDAMTELESRATQFGYPDFALHKAALLTVTGNFREALPLARAYPDERLFPQLLIKTGAWDELRKIAFGSSPRFREEFQRISNAAFLNRDAASARAYYENLPADSKARNVLFLLLSGNDELCREVASTQFAKAPAYFSLSIPLSLNPFEIWQDAVVDSMKAIKPPAASTFFPFFAHITMTSDCTKTIAILEQLSQQSSPESQQFQVAHALIELGAVEQGCRILKSQAPEKNRTDKRMQSKFQSAFIPDHFATNGHSEYLKLAELEFPAATDLERHESLAKLLAGNAPPEACVQVLALLQKHQAKIPLPDASLLLQKLSIALWGEPLTEEIRLEAEKVFSAYHPTEKQSEFFQRWAQAPPWQEKFSVQTKISLEPGIHHDPKSIDFRIIDGMAEVRRLLENNELENAEALFHQLEKRILLSDFPDEEIKVIHQSNQCTASFGSSISAELLPILAAHYWNLDASFLREYSLNTWRREWDTPPEFLVSYLAHSGAFREARIAALELQIDGTPSHLDEIRTLPAIDGLAAASEGQVDAALQYLKVCMNLSPMDPRSGMAILSIFKKNENTQAIQRATTQIRSYWKQQLTQYPHSHQVLEASHYWLSELEKNF